MSNTFLVATSEEGEVICILRNNTFIEEPLKLALQEHFCLEPDDEEDSISIELSPEEPYCVSRTCKVSGAIKEVVTLYVTHLYEYL